MKSITKPLFAFLSRNFTKMATDTDNVTFCNGNNKINAEDKEITSNGHLNEGEMKNDKQIDEEGEGLFGLKPTLHCSDVPVLYREANVEKGFRPTNQNWHYYLRSAFQLHNETVNIWTHFMAAIGILAQLAKFSHDIDFIHDPYAWQFLTGMLCSIIMYMCSAGAHSMQSKSTICHYVSFMIDYAGIGIYALGSVIVHFEYCSEPIFYNTAKTFFIPLGCILALLLCFCCVYAKVRYQRPYPWQRKMLNVVPVAAIYILLVSPIVHRLHSCFVLGQDCNHSIPYHSVQICLFLLSGFFYASEVPQRFLPPGSCDFFLHSHQLFHISISFCTMMQMEGVYRDFHERSDFLRSRPVPSLHTAFGPMILTILWELLVIVFFRLKLQQKLVKNEIKMD